ncbi:MAG: DUF726 domain-containing protein [Candidatus Competibacteraceae bacterium]
MKKTEEDNGYKKTVQCRFCENMAKTGEYWDDRLCAEHAGIIASFEKLSMKLNDITDYKKIFERDSFNIQKIATTGLFAIAGAAVIGPVAFAAAPAIGGTLGALLGYSGAVATNVGLATLGGGALAAGGFGMAGGTAIIAASGAMLGGTFGGVVSNIYFGNIEDFDIELIKPGVGPKVIFIDGFLTQKNPDPSDWKKSLEKVYPNNPWYHLKWESKRLYDIGKNLGGYGVNAAAKELLGKWAAQASKQAAKKVGGPAAWALTIAGLVNNPWSVASVKAAQTGVLLADIIARTDDQYILCGHSLGARVIYYALESLRTKNKCFIDTTHLLGGAVGNQAEDWQQTANAVHQVIHNYHSDNDKILEIMYDKIHRFYFFGSSPIGRYPIPSSDPRIQNHDVTAFVSGHRYHKDNFHKFAHA